ncbi:MAG: hypothetical protein RLZZ04_1436 [Cyanobacteriota bacterium]|jgi:hypothetical protein
MKVRFLLDENLSPRLKLAVLRLNPQIDILRVGGSDAPALGTLDPDILVYLQKSQRILLTDNRKSMPEHLQEHWVNNLKEYIIDFLLKQYNLMTEYYQDAALKENAMLLYLT